MKPSVKFGLITGLCVGLWVIVCFSVVSWINDKLQLGIYPANIRAYSGLFSILVLIIGIYMGMKNTRLANQNELTYGRAVITGITVSVITAAIVSTFSFLYCTVINPGYADYMVHEAEKAMAAAHKTPEEITSRLAQVKSEFSTSSQVMQALIGQSVVGSICSLIIGLFVKRKSSNTR